MLSKMLIARQQLRKKKVPSKHNVRSNKKTSIPSICSTIIPNFLTEIVVLVFIDTIPIELECLMIL